MGASKVAARAAVVVLTLTAHRSMFFAMIAVIASFSIASAAGPPASDAADWRHARTARVGTLLRFEVEAADARRTRQTLSVQRIDPFAPSAVIVAHTGAGDVGVPRPETVWFTGVIEGNPESLVTLAIDAAGSPRGFVVEDGAHWVVEGGAAGPARLVRAPAAPSSMRSFCGTTAADAPPGLLSGTPPPGGRSARSVTTRAIDLALETDYELFAGLGSTTAVLEYIGDLVATTATIYRRDVDATFRIVYLSLWTAGAGLDPWTFANKVEGIEQFRNYWVANRQGVARNLAHFVSGYAVQDGGLAEFAALCQPTNGFGFAFTNMRLVDLPNVGPYNPLLFAHELGHQLGSVHTHCYDPPIDECYGSEPGCYAGPVSQPPDGGGIMSYCTPFTPWISRPGFYGDRSERVSQTIDAYISASSGCLATVTCGDGALDAGEDCDDGNGVNGDGCSAICGFETACGNGTQESNEQCDDGNTNASDGCTDRCTICGNGTTTAPFEECDDGNTTDDDVCSASCRVPRCGDGYVTAPEECDDGNDVDDDGCTLGCTTCGNGTTSDPETCDDGDLDAGDGCEPGCVPTAVGRNLTLVGTPVAMITHPVGSGSYDLEIIRDRVRPPVGSSDTTRQFDTFTYFDANLPVEEWIGYELPGPHTFTELLFQEGMHFPNGGWFTALDVQVRKDGVWVPVSGLSVSPSYPGVDDGVSYETHRISFDPTSGEAIRLFGPGGGSDEFISIGELWVYGTPSAGTCGNGVVEGVESCDDGPQNGLGGCCSTTCQRRVDGTVCDDAIAGTCPDVCQTGTCVGATPVCGDGIHASCTEQCDDGNTIALDGCSPTCTIEGPGVCGNGTLEFGEQCDDGDEDDVDGCTFGCTTCGNGTTTAPEQCDDGNLMSGDGCEAGCVPTGVGQNLIMIGEPIVKVVNPGGIGSHDLESIRDRDRPPVGTTDTLRQYDTYNGTAPEAEEWVGYEFLAPYTFTELLFQEGMNFYDGGWFTSLTVQVRQEGVWTSVTGLTVTPSYPGTGNGIHYETYRVSFTPTSGDAIRLFGPAGGSAGFISIGELWVYGTPYVEACGNGVREGAEDCDDGNLVDGDLCSSSCQLDCPVAPLMGCRLPTAAGKSSLLLKNASDPAKDQLSWTWGSGATTPKTDFGQPHLTDSYVLCVWKAAGELVSAVAPAGGLCGTKPCWTEKPKSFSYKNKLRQPDGLEKMDLKEGLAGKAKIGIKGKGALLGIPSLAGVAPPVTVQLIRPGGPCWGAVFSAPFVKHDAAQLKDKSD